MKKLIAVIVFVSRRSRAWPPAAGGAAAGQHRPEQPRRHSAWRQDVRQLLHGCHSAKYVRYKLFTEVGLTEDDIKDNLMFTDGKIGDLMKIAMPEEDAGKWFGAPAPT